MKADALLSRLDRVKRTGEGRWQARCPAHDDRGPSLSIRELQDGRVLLHCFAGCCVEDVIGAVGMTFDDLFPEKLVPDAKRERLPFNPLDVLHSVGKESLIVMLASRDLLSGKSISDADHKRLVVAVGRINEAVRICNGSR